MSEKTMADVFLFAGTIEGKELTERFCKSGLSVHVFTATEYGASLLPGSDQADGSDVRISNERLDEPQMVDLMQKESPRLIIDATHPYAVVVSENIRSAAGRTGIKLIRLNRRESDIGVVTDAATKSAGGKVGENVNVVAGDAVVGNVIHVASVQEAVDFLRETRGAVLLTCGSKELAAFTAIPDYKERLYARVLSTEEVVRSCAALGFSGKHLIAMQGPFSLEMNQALIRHTGAEWLVTKESGVQGGFPEKAEAAAREGIGLVVIDRPAQVDMVSAVGSEAADSPKSVGSSDVENNAAQNVYLVCDSVESCWAETCQTFGIASKRKFTLLGIGPGSVGGLTIEGMQALQEADLVMGASRMLEILEEADHAGLTQNERKPSHRKTTFATWKPAEMQQYVLENPQYQNIVVALSGDTGFYSGAAKLLELWKDEDVCVLPGLSTLSVLCAKAKTDWQPVRCISRHGRTGNLLSALRTESQVFLLPGEKLPELCEKLIAGGFCDVSLAVGSKLSYPDEQVFIGTPKELKEMSVQEPYAVLISNPAAVQEPATPGIPDGDFLRIMRSQADDSNHTVSGTAEDTDARVSYGTDAVSRENGLSETNLTGKHDSKAAGKQSQKSSEKHSVRTVPMTKEEVRVVSLGKLRLTRSAVVYDIGAGTGSVSIEAARIACEGRVYAIEQNPQAVGLLRENVAKFGLDNVDIIEGMAPEAFEGLPMPTHAFIGGSKGNLAAIVARLREMNPAVRIVINAVTVETADEARRIMQKMETAQETTIDADAKQETAANADARHEKAAGARQEHGRGGGFCRCEAVTLQVTREHKVGRYHMLRAENPITIFAFGGETASETVSSGE